LLTEAVGIRARLEPCRESSEERGFSPWAAAVAKALWIAFIAARLKPCPDTALLLNAHSYVAHPPDSGLLKADG